MPYSLVVFDFDGTLANTLDAAFKIYNQLADDRGLRKVAEEELERFRHFTLKELLRELEIPKIQVPRLLAAGMKKLRKEVADMALFEGMADVVKALASQNVPTGILTSNSVENVEAFLKAKDLENQFEFISSTNRLTGKAKYLNSIRRTFSKTADQVLYIGDEIRDIKASHKANIDVAAVSWGFNAAKVLRAAEPTYLFDRPSELLSFIGNATDAG